MRKNKDFHDLFPSMNRFCWQVPKLGFNSPFECDNE
jgi:hypothetical protein